MMDERDTDAAAQMLLSIYSLAIWPLGTFAAGFESIGLMWPLIGMAPICAYIVLAVRKRGLERVERYSFPLVFIFCGLICGVALLGVYYLGFGLQRVLI